jgi:hypothetical protein
MNRLRFKVAVANQSAAVEADAISKNGRHLKNRLKNVCVILVILFMGSRVYGQDAPQVYLGPGMGLDYGGLIGGKIEYLPVKNFGLYGGLGYNLLSVGWNVGATYKILPDKRVSPNLMLFYGYNGVTKVDGGFSEYEMTSYGVTIGGNLDIRIGSRGDKLSVGLFVPIRSQKFMDNYDAMKNDPRIEVKSELLPIAISVGYNFLLKN